MTEGARESIGVRKRQGEIVVWSMLLLLIQPVTEQLKVVIHLKLYRLWELVVLRSVLAPFLDPNVY